MRTKMRQIITGAAITVVGVVATRSLAPKLHEHCQAHCEPGPEHAGDDPPGVGCCPRGVHHAA